METTNEKEVESVVEQQKQKWREEQHRIASQVLVIPDDNDESSKNEENKSDDDDDDKNGSIMWFGRNRQFQFVPLSWYDSRTTDTTHKNSNNNNNYFGGVDVSFPKNDDEEHDNDVEDQSKERHSLSSSSMMAVAAYVIVDISTQTVIYQDVLEYQVTVPYIPSYLAFREVDPLVTLIRRQQQNQPNVTPRAILVDGNGIFHARFAGLACFVGVLTQIPTIGVGKTCSSVHDITLTQVNDELGQSLQDIVLEINQNEDVARKLEKRQQQNDGCGVIFHHRQRLAQLSPPPTEVASTTKNDDKSDNHEDACHATKLVRGPAVQALTPNYCHGVAVPLVSPSSGRTLACALVGHGGGNKYRQRSRKNPQKDVNNDDDISNTHGGCKSGTKNPIFISVGHGISLQEAVVIAARCCTHARIPEPVRQADAIGRELLRQRYTQPK